MTHRTIKRPAQTGLCLLAIALALAAPAQTNNSTAGVHSAGTASAPPSDGSILLDILQKKGLISDEDASQAREALAASHKELQASSNASAFNFKTSGAIKSMELFGDIRLRYEYRAGELASAEIRPAIPTL